VGEEIIMEHPFGWCEFCFRNFVSREEKMANTSMLCGYGFYTCPRCKAIVEDATQKIKSGADIREDHLPDQAS
jgi:hypothetical protein